MHSPGADADDVKGSKSRPSDPVGDLDEADEILSDLGAAPSPAASLRDRARDWSDRSAFEALSLVARTVAANLDFPSLVREILDIAVRSIGAERGIVFIGTSPDAELVPVVARSVSGQDLVELERVSRTILRRVLSGETVETADAAADPALRDVPSIRLHEIRSVLCVPLTVRDELLGAIYLDNGSVANAFPEPSRRFLEAFAGLAAAAIGNAQRHGEVLRENAQLRTHVTSSEAFGRLVSVSPGMLGVIRRASLVAQSEAPVLVLGESGTGKELLARSIHEASRRSLQPFIAHNCAAVPPDLMESLFFGHTKGAFTGAVRETHGLFRQADRGVLFLDEVAELDSSLQAKLLRVLQDGVIRPVGSEREIQVDVRLITATSRDLYAAVRAGAFREELLYRINVLEVRVPPLRERVEDIPVLVDHFLRKHAPRDGRPPVLITRGAIEMLQSHPWKGNVRELENLVRRVLVLCDGPRADVAEVRPLLTRPEECTPAAAEAPRIPLEAGVKSLAEREREAIVDALGRERGNKTRAAKLLGLHRNSLLRRMERLKIHWDE
jgi:transcriptional regulator with GAF, ATPase, and Fis domain